MIEGSTTARPAQTAARPEGRNDSRDDPRFRALLDAAEWSRLPAEVRARFSRKAGPGRSIGYVGQVVETRMTRLGRLLARACLLIGGPLPSARDAGVACIVFITEDPRGGGQTWTRLYARRTGFPQVIHSAKRFAGPTGLEEHVGHGVGMTLGVSVEDGALVFRSERYYVEALGWRLYLPGWLTPGTITVRHTPISAARFVFSLEIDHPRFGRLFSQSVDFEEMRP